MTCKLIPSLWPLWAAVFCAVLLKSCSCSSHYPWVRGNISLSHSANAYCDPSSFLLRSFEGRYLEKFVAVHAISDSTFDIEGYAGYDPIDHAIYIVFRGSSSFSNYWTDAKTDLVPYSHCSGCLVHDGFAAAEETVVPSGLISVLETLHNQFPNYPAVFTGHSLGGALATLSALRVIHERVFPANAVQLFTFGSPRVGNLEFAQYASDQLLASFRVTHHKDIIPHLPPRSFGFLHVADEWYQPGDVAEIYLCDSFSSAFNFSTSKPTLQEDDSCASQWYFYETSTTDHLTYLTNPVGHDSCASYTGNNLAVDSGSAMLASEVFIKVLSTQGNVSSMKYIDGTFSLKSFARLIFYSLPVILLYYCWRYYDDFIMICEDCIYHSTDRKELRREYEEVAPLYDLSNGRHNRKMSEEVNRFQKYNSKS